MMKMINAFPGMDEPMTEEEVKNFMTNNENKLLIRLGIISEREEPNVIPLAYDNPMSPLKGVRGKGVVKIHDEDINRNIDIAKKFIMKNIGNIGPKRKMAPE